MCLQWCHVQRWLIDNDLECAGCERGAASDLPGEWSCAGCSHLRQAAGAAPSCALTRARLPLLGRCCHWQAEPVLEETARLAPWLAAEDRQLGSLRLGDLSVPLVYGVPADAWPAAVDPDECEQSGEPLDLKRRLAIEAAIDACEAGDTVLRRARRALDAALAPGGEQGLPAAWRAIVAELRQLLEP